MIKILVADDHALLRKALIQLIKDEFPEAEIKEAENGQVALDNLRKEKFSIAILDMTMPERDGMDVLKQLPAHNITTPVLVLSMHPEELYAQRILRAGGSGYLSKDCNPEELILAIQTILKGEHYISRSFAGKLATIFSGKSPQEEMLHEKLSDRELQVLKLYAQGKTTNEISDILSITINSVSTYKGRIRDKLHLKSSADLIRFAIDNGLCN
jgi:DNA-binding NarL/FixJ family response regulator